MNSSSGRRSASGVGLLLVDLDGVIRLYDPDDTLRVEEEYGLPRGAIEAIAFAEDLMSKVTTGAISRREWVHIIGKRIGDAKAALAWERRPVAVEWRVLRITDELRGRGVRVALITNGTDNLTGELKNLGIISRFDAIYNSSEIGTAKPSAQIYSHVLACERLTADRVAYVDDTLANVLAARSLGIRSALYRHYADFENWLCGALNLI